MYKVVVREPAGTSALGSTLGKSLNPGSRRDLTHHTIDDVLILLQDAVAVEIDVQFPLTHTLRASEQRPQALAVVLSAISRIRPRRPRDLVGEVAPAVYVAVDVHVHARPARSRNR